MLRRSCCGGIVGGGCVFGALGVIGVVGSSDAAVDVVVGSGVTAVDVVVSGGVGDAPVDGDSEAGVICYCCYCCCCCRWW